VLLIFQFTNIKTVISLVVSKDRSLLWCNKLYPVVRLMNFISAVLSLISLCFNVKVMGYLKYKPLIEIVFGLNLVPKHCSEFQKFGTGYLFLTVNNLFT
jgi:hypothetical protein